MGAPGNRIWEHATETVLLLDVGALAAVAVLPAAGTPLWTIPVVAGAGGLVTGFVIWCLTGSARFSWTAVAMGLYVSGWSVWAGTAPKWYATGPSLAWLLGVIAFVPLFALAAAHARDHIEPEIAKPDPNAAKLEEMARFEHMFASLGFGEEGAGVQVLDLNMEPGGRVLRLSLPRSGNVTMSDLEAKSGRIEVILRMKPGTVEFSHAGHSGDIVMRLRERDFMNQTIPFRAEHRATTIRKPFAIGVQEDGSIASITLRRLHARIIGVTDAGKSNLLNVVMAQLCGMTDTIIWVIDMKGGMVARPWLRPFAEGRTSVPAIDWVATTREEAALMMHCFVKAVNYRADNAHGSEIIPSASQPQLILITDEMTDLFGVGKGSRKEVGDEGTTNNQFITLAEEVTRKGRALAASSVWASQRGTNSMGGTGDMKANIKLEIILGVAKQSEAMYVNADNRAAQKRAAAMVDTPGAGTITMGSKGSLATKFFYLDHPKEPGHESDRDRESLCANGCVPQCPIYRVAMETATVRPQLERPTALALGEEYAERWQRAEKVLRRPVPAGGATLTAVKDVDTSDFDTIMRKGFGADPEAKLNERQAAVLDILRVRGVLGATPNTIEGELRKRGINPPARETISRWLAMFRDQDLAHRESFGRWKIGPDPRKNEGVA